MLINLLFFIFVSKHPVHRGKYIMIKFSIKVLLLLLIIIKPNSLESQEYISTLSNLTTLNGLPNNEVGAILKDSKGFMWFGTKSGLCRFDGHEIKNYAPLLENEILSLEELDSNTLLIGTISSLYVYNKRLDKFTINKELKATRMKAIKKIDENSFLVGTEVGLFIISRNGNIIGKIPLDKGISPSNQINSITKEKTNIFWITTNNGLARYDVSTQKTSFYKMTEDVNYSNYLRCLAIVDSTIYVGSFNKGVFSFNPKTQKFNKIKAFGNDFILSIADNSNGDLFVGTDGKGVKIYSIKKEAIIDEVSRKKGVIRSNTIRTLNIYNNILWIGSLSGGVSYTPSIGDDFIFYQRDKVNTTNYNIRSSFIFDNGDKLIGTRSGLIYVSEERNIVKEFTTETPGSQLRSDIILDIQQLDNKILVGTYGGGLYQFNRETLSLTDFSKDPIFINGCFFRIAMDTQKTLWLATNEGLIHSSMDGRILKRYETNNSGLKDNLILFLYIDSNNRIWLCTHSSLSVLEPETGIIKSDIFSPEYNKILNLVNYILEDSNYNIWFCTNHGLLKVNSDLIIKAHYSEPYSLPENIVKSVIEDNDKNLWFTTLKNIVKYNPNTNTFTYQYLEGLSTYEFNNNVHKASDGTIWWANEGGLVHTNNKKPTEPVNSKYYPTITSYFISNIEYDLTNLEVPDRLTLSSTDNNIRLKLSYMNYSLPNSDVFEYKLEGYDSDWRRIIGRNDVSYSDLPAGNYIFKLRVPNNYSNEKSLYIKVNRSYSTIIWITIVLIVCATLLIYFFFKLKIIKLKAKKERIILTDVQDQSKSQTPINISEERVDDLIDKLMTYMQTDKPYLDPRLKIKTISDKLNCDVSDLSQILNNVMNVNFADFINVYRVNEFKDKLASQNLSRFTIKGLSEQSGFNSKSTFYRAFKKISGKTPLEYCKEKGITIAED